MKSFNCPSAQTEHWTSPGFDWWITLTQLSFQQELRSSSSLSSVLETLWVSLIGRINFNKCSPLRQINTLFPAVINTFKDSFIHCCKHLKQEILKTVDGEKWETLRGIKKSIKKDGREALKRSHHLFWYTFTTSYTYKGFIKNFVKSRIPLAVKETINRCISAHSEGRHNHSEYLLPFPNLKLLKWV